MEGRIKNLEKLIKFPESIEELEEKIKYKNESIKGIKEELDVERERIRQENNHLKQLKELFKDTLLQVKFPDFTQENSILIDPFTFSPKIKRTIEKDESSEEIITDFYNLSSGGKKAIFKACFGLAIHRLTAKIDGKLPSFLMIDTPMKNLNEEINKVLCNAFYQFVYKLSKTELKNTQIVLIDKMYFMNDDKITVKERELTYDPEHPRLF